MKTDTAIKHNVEAELHWEPEVEDRDISVKVDDGVVVDESNESRRIRLYHSN